MAFVEFGRPDSFLQGFGTDLGINSASQFFDIDKADPTGEVRALHDSSFSDSVKSFGNSISSIVDLMNKSFSDMVENENSSAQKQMDFQRSERLAAQAFNEASAQKQMDFQERMSNTQYQRAVADLKAAGLNPILAAGAAASSPSGASSSISAMSGSKANTGQVGSFLERLLVNSLSVLGSSLQSQSGFFYDLAKMFKVGK